MALLRYLERLSAKKNEYMKYGGAYYFENESATPI